MVIRLVEEHLDDSRLDRLFRLGVDEISRRAWELKGGLRDLYHAVDPAAARAYLKAWCQSAARSKLRPFVNLADQIRRHFDGIVAAVEHNLSNSRFEGSNAKIRLINRRGYGHPHAHDLAAMIHLCLGGITIQLPMKT